MKAWHGILALLAGCLLSVGQARAGQAAQDTLLLPVEGGEKIVKDAMEQRVRRVKVNLPLLNSLEPGHPHDLTLDLFPDARYEVTLTRRETHSATCFTWFGSLKGHPESPLMLATDGKVALLTLTITGKTQFTVHPEAGGTELVSEAVANGNRRCGGAADGPAAPLDVTDPKHY